MKTNIQNFKTAVNKNTDTLKQRYHVDRIGVFGSVARAENTASSDIDVLVRFSQPVGFFTFLELEEFLSKAIGKKVDLVTENALKPAIKEAILRDVIYV